MKETVKVKQLALSLSLFLNKMSVNLERTLRATLQACADQESFFRVSSFVIVFF